MGLLSQKFREKVSKEKDERVKMEANADVSYATGFLALDFLNGTMVHVKTENKDYCYNAIGIVDGSANTFIGRTGCGKSTLIVQTSANIVRPFKTSCIFHDDIEGGMGDSRIEILTKFTPQELKDKYIYRNTGITAENFYQRIKMIHDLKIENKSEYEYDTGLEDRNGARIFKFEPTIYIIDSIPLLMPDKVTEEEELSGQMTATGAAKVNTRIFKQIVPLLKAANIILMCVNHILDDVQINPFAKQQSQVAYLKQGERLPGGKAVMYLANNMFRLDDSKLKADQGFNISGVIVDLTIIKSRTNKSGRSIPLVLNYDTGYDDILSLFMLLKANNLFKGAGVGLMIGDCPVKFSQKNFKEKLAANPDLQAEFSKVCYEVLHSLLSTPYISAEDNSCVVDITSQILQLGKVA